MNKSVFDLFTQGPLWIIESWIFVIFMALVFTCSPAIWVNKDITLPPAYELKADHPFADTSTLTIPAHEGERSHGAKLTPRLVGSILLNIATRASCHPYLPATLFGCLFLLSGIVIGFQITHDRLVALFIGLIFSGLYATSACFSINLMPKPFDGVVIGLLGLTLISIQRPWLLATTSFLSCWSDERAVLSLLFIAVVVLSWPSVNIQKKLRQCSIIALSIVSYVATRLVITFALGWQVPDISYIGDNIQLSLLFAQVAAWLCFKGGWIPIVYVLFVLHKQQAYMRLALISCAILLAIVSCLIVLDASRASAFAFPLIPACFALLTDSGTDKRDMRIIAGVSAVVTLLSPNYEIIIGVAVKWLRPFPFFIFLK